MNDTARTHLQRRILQFMDDALSSHETEDFVQLALEVHQWQRQYNNVLPALCPTLPTRLHDIPAVPVDLFKQLNVSTLRTAQHEHVTFRTSGTTTQRRGEHHLRDTRLYDHGALHWAQRCVPGLPSRIVALLHDPSVVSDASLSHMVALFSTPDHVSWHLHEGRLDIEGLHRSLQGLSVPVFVATTAFALADWLDHAPSPLPGGSILMVTGGFKGRRTELSDADLYAAARTRLQPERLVTEYGMTELSSQLWGTPESPYVPPLWLRVVAVHPATGEPVPFEEPGQLRFYDLANLDSTVGIETLDQGIVHADGSVRLLGRLQGAEVRGCSLTVEDAQKPSTPVP
jgi:hypothetical protein